MRLKSLIRRSMQQALGHAKSGLGAIALFASIGGLLTFLTQALLARFMSPDDVGRFGTIAALATLIAPIGGAGVYGVWLQMFPKPGGNYRWVCSGISLAAACTTALMLALAGWGFITLGTQGAVLFTLIGSQLFSLVALELNSGSLQVRRRYSKFAIYQAWPQALRFLILLTCGLSWHNYASSQLFAFALGQFTYAVIVLAVCTKELRNFKRDTAKADDLNPTLVRDGSVRNVAYFGWPFVTNSLLLAVNAQSAIIVAGYVLEYSDAAIYIAAASVVGSGYLLIGLVYRRYFQPRMFYLVEHDVSGYQHFARSGLRLSIAFGLVLAVGVAAVSNLFLTAIFGPAYAPAVSVVNILAITVFLRCIINHIGCAFVRRPEMVFRSRVQFIGLIINIPLMILFARHWGVTGIALSAVLFDCYLLAILNGRFRRLINVCPNGLEHHEKGGEA